MYGDALKKVVKLLQIHSAMLARLTDWRDTMTIQELLDELKADVIAAQQANTAAEIAQDAGIAQVEANVADASTQAANAVAQTALTAADLMTLQAQVMELAQIVHDHINPPTP